MPQGQTALDYVLGGSAPAPSQTALDWVMGPGSETSQPGKSDFPQGPPGPLPFAPMFQGMTPRSPPSSGQSLPGAALSGLEDVVRGTELGAGRMLKFAGQMGQRGITAIEDSFGSEKTRAEKAREVQRAAGPGEALTAQGLTHPEPTSFPGRVLQGVGEMVPIYAAGPAGIVLASGPSIEDRYNQILKATGNEAVATEGAVAEVPLQLLQMLPVMRLFGGEGGTLARKALDGAISGALGPGSARVLGEVLSEKLTQGEKADLGAALKRGFGEAAQQTPQNATVFALLSAAAGIGEPVKPAADTTPAQAKADKLGGGQTPTKATSGTTPNVPGTQIPASLESGPSTPLAGQIPNLPDEAAALPPETASEASAGMAQAEHDRIVEAAKAYQANPTPAARVQLASVATPRPEPPQTTPEPRPSIQNAAQDPALVEVANRYLTGGERGKLDAREQIQDQMREFLTPQDIQDIATWKPGAKTSENLPNAEPSRLPGMAQPSVTPTAEPELAWVRSTSAGPSGLEAKAEVAAAASPIEAPRQERPSSSEPVGARPPEGLPTSTKNSITESERAMRGEPPLEEAMHKAWGTSLDTARAAMEKDPALTQRIIEGKATPELTRDEREAALASEKVTAHNEYERVRDAALAESGNPDAFKALEEQRQKLSDRLLEIDAATKREGTEWGRTGSIRRMMLARDYSIAAVETEFRLAKGGAQLTPEEMTKAEDLSRRLIAAEKQVEEIEGALAVKREAKAAVTKKANVLSFLDAQAEQARARLAAKRGRAGGGLPFDPQDILDVARIAASHIAHGIDAGVQLVKDFGEEIRPHLEAILAKAREMHEQAGKQSGSEKAAITRATNTAAKLRAKTAAQDFEPKPKPEPLPMTPERLKAKADLEEARKEYETQKARFRFANRTMGQKVRDVAREALNVPKQLLTGFDLSATLFQGGVLASSHPIISARAFKESLRAFSSERKALEIDTALRNRPLAAEGEKAGLELTQLDGPLSAHEEHIRSNWAGKIPFGIGKGVEASNRAFTTMLNVQRSMSFDKMAEGSPDKSPEAQNAFANYVNVATGRGYTPAKMRAAVSAASNILWSPRLLISRFQLLAGQPLYRGTASSRKAIAGEYAKSLIALGGVYTIAALAGADVDKDPRSSAFGKIKLGNVYVDPLLGLSQVTHIISEVGTGEKKNAKGDIVPLRAPILEEGKGPKYGQASTADELFSFLRKKFSPTIGVPLDILAGKNVVGQPVTPADLPQEMLVPLAFQDVYKAMRDGGVPEAVALGLLSVLGAHVEVHDQDRTPKLRLSGPSHAPPKR